ncbi:MAG: HEAT repeat domain-containing protein [Roseateles sp.]
MMNTTTTCRRYTVLLAAALVVALLVPSVHAQETAAEKQHKAIEVLKSDQHASKKAMACKHLAIWGTADAVPYLAKLLSNAELASWCRIALEAIPDPAADAALREAAGNLKGRLLIGTLNSIGVRRDVKAVPVLTGKLTDADADVISAAAVALGRIGNEPAAEALQPLLTKAPAGAREAVAEGCILCAEKRLAEETFSDALDLYTAVRKANISKQKTREATRGAILAMREKGIPLLAEQLESKEKDLFNLGLHVAREVPGPAVTKALLAALKKADPQRQGYLLLAMAERGDTEALPMAMKMAAGGPRPSRLMALRVLDELGDPAAVKVLLKIIGEADKGLSAAARKALTRLPAGKTDAAVLEMLADPAAATRRLALELVLQRQIAGAVPALMKATKDADETVRKSAMKALRGLAGMKQFPLLLAMLLEGKSAEDIRAAESVVTAVAMRSARLEKGDVVIVKAVYGDKASGKIRDVTKKVAGMVKAGIRKIEATNTNFGDPAAGKPKALHVTYRSGGRVVTKTVREDETLSIAVRTVPPACTGDVVAALAKAGSEPKQALLRVLRRFGGPKALEAVRKATKDANAAVKETALQALFEWQSDDALPDLKELARTAPTPTFKILALHGYIRLVRQQDAPPEERLAALKDAASLAERDDDMKRVLGALGTIATVESLAMVTPHLEKKSLREEAAAAVVAIVAPMKPRPDAATEALQKVAKAPVSNRTKRRAQELLRKK